MAKKRRKKKSIFRSTFYRIYFAVVLLCILGIIFGTRYLDVILADYESSQPVHTARLVAQLFENADYETIYTLDSSVSDETGIDQAYYAETMRSIASGKAISWNEIYSSSDDIRKYSVSLDGETLADFSLVPSGRETEHGNRIWALSSIASHVTIAQTEPEPTPTPQPVQMEMFTCTVTVPETCSVEVNGKQLDANNVVTAGIPTFSAGLLPEGVASPTMIQYAFLSENTAPEIRVTNAAGEIQTLERTSETDWTSPLPQAPELQTEFEEHVLKVAKRISSYSAKDATEASVLQYCAKNSPARESIKNFDNTWGTRHNGATFENVKTYDYYQYSGDCFSCKVSFDYVATFGKSTVKTYPTTYTLYFIREGDTGKLYSFTLY